MNPAANSTPAWMSRTHPLAALALAIMITSASPVLAIDAHTDEGPFRLTELLECRSRIALATPIESVATHAESSGFTCRSSRSVQQRSLNCVSGRRVSAWSSSVKEFTLSHAGDGGVSLSVALVAPVASIERALASGDLLDAPDNRAVELREDGAAELGCQISASGTNHGAIGGRLTFRGVEPLPAMRVCAAPIDDPENPVCENSREGQHQYRIASLPAGRYFLTAFPLGNNPHRLFVVHAPERPGCSADDPACTTTRLQAVDLHAGEERDGVDLETVLPELPGSLGRRNR